MIICACAGGENGRARHDVMRDDHAGTSEVDGSFVMGLLAQDHINGNLHTPLVSFLV